MPHPPDEPSLVTDSSTPVAQVLPPNSTALGSLVIPSAQATADHPATPLTAISNPHITETTTSIPQSAYTFPPSTIAPRQTGSTTHVPLSPPIVPEMSFLSPLPLSPNNALHMDSQLLLTSSPSQLNQTPPSQGLSLSNSGTTVPPIPLVPPFLIPL